MNLLSRAYGLAGTGPTGCLLGTVSHTLISDLRNHGLATPLKGLNDPRLEYPELLLIDGWERQTPGPDCCFSYQYVSPSKPQWQQTYDSNKDGSRTLTTRCGHMQNVISEDRNGQMRSTWRTI